MNPLTAFVSFLGSEHLVLHLPEVILLNLGAFSLILVGYLVEEHYVSRPSIFANAMAVNLFFSQFLAGQALSTGLTVALTLYMNIGLLIGVVSIISYWTKLSLWEEFYDIFGFVYGSFTVGALIVVSNLI